MVKIIRDNSRPLAPIATGLKDDGIISNKIKCVLFDIYGTLFISGSGDISTSEKKSHEREVEKVLLKYRVPKHADEVYRAYLESIEKEHRRLKSKGIDYPEVRIEQIWKNILKVSIFKAKRIAVEYETLVNPVWPMPGAVELISQLDLMGVKLGIISNAQFYTSLIFKALMGKFPPSLGFSRNLIFYSYRYGISKPSLMLFGHAVKMLKNWAINPENTLYIGNDILNDVKPASEVGFKTALFAGDRRSLRLRKEDERCRNVKPDIIVTSLINTINMINL